MPDPASRRRVTVFVLGDLGRSPRMLHHALALADDDAAVSLVGYLETEVEKAVSENPRIRIYKIQSIRRASEGTPQFWFLFITGLRVALLTVESLWVLLVRTPRADAILVQNPPSFPTLLAGRVAARLRGSGFVVDWHNFGYSILALRLGETHFVVRLARRWERSFGAKADAHFCVSAAMRAKLVKEFGLEDPAVLRDKPTELLPLVPIASRSAAARPILARSGLDLPLNAALAVCPTSWTADEDMELLLDALKRWDATTSPSHELFVLITGRGPMRESFEKRFAAIPWQHVLVRTAFFVPADYREVLRAAHLGLCLHRSSSGVDLPMKIMDLFGAATPVCVLDYGASLTEQIQPGVTALTFRNSHELAVRIDELLHGFPAELQRLEQIQRNIVEFCAETWQQAWQREAAPVLHRLYESL